MQLRTYLIRRTRDGRYLSRHGKFRRDYPRTFMRKSHAEEMLKKLDTSDAYTVVEFELVETNA